MQNFFQVGFALADFGQSAGKADGTGPAQALRDLTDAATAKADGQPVIPRRVEVTGSPGAPQFEAVFETLAPGAMTPNGTSPQDRADPMLAMAQASNDPSDQIVHQDTLFDAIDAGDIVIDEIFPPGTALNAQLTAAVANRTAQPMGADQLTSGTVVQPAPSEPGATLEALQQIATTAQPGSAVQSAAMRLQAQVTDVQTLVTQAGPSMAPDGPHQRGAPAGPMDAGLDRLSGAASVTTPGASLGAPSLNAGPFGAQSAMSQLTAVADRISGAMADHSATADRAQGPMNATQAQPASVPTTQMQLSTGAATPQQALSTLAHRLEQARKSDAVESAAQRLGSAEDQVNAFATKRPGAAAAATTASPFGAPPVAGLMHALQTQNTQAAQANSSALDTPGMTLDGHALPQEARTLGTLGTPTQQALQTPMTPAQAQQVTRQIAIAMQNNPNRTVEITLSPAELGRVRISLSSAEAGMVVSIQADRPETLDLMRRNAELLSGDFRDIGYEGTSFSFEGSEHQAGAGGAFSDLTRDPDAPTQTLDATDQAEGLADTDTQDDTRTQTIILADGAVDIRM